MFTPVRGEAASASWPSRDSLFTSFDPIRPVPPTTTTLMTRLLGTVHATLPSAPGANPSRRQSPSVLMQQAA
ncbi:hypothetical protein GCM10027203_64250 [Nonomuraea fastidiosa]